MFQGGQQEGPEAPPFGRGPGNVMLLEQPGEERLRQVLGIIRGGTPAPHEHVKGYQYCEERTGPGFPLPARIRAVKRARSRRERKSACASRRRRGVERLAPGGHGIRSIDSDPVDAESSGAAPHVQHVLAGREMQRRRSPIQP